MVLSLTLNVGHEIKKFDPPLFLQDTLYSIYLFTIISKNNSLSLSQVADESYVY